MTRDPSLPPDVALAIEQLYDVFARYPFANVAACACCNAAEEIDRMRVRLRSVPLRELTAADMAFVVSEILPMWGDDDDVKHVLPRLMELGGRLWLLGELEAGLDDVSAMWLHPDLALRGLHRSGWLHWPADERRAVEASLFALFGATVANGTPRQPWSTWSDEGLLIAILSLVPDPVPYLETFLAGPVPARHLAWTIRALLWPGEIPDLGVLDADAGAEIRRAEIIAWLLTDAPREALLRAIGDPASEAFRWELVLGLEELRTPASNPFDRDRHGGWMPDAAARARAKDLGVVLERGPYRLIGDWD